MKKIILCVMLFAFALARFWHYGGHTFRKVYARRPDGTIVTSFIPLRQSDYYSSIRRSEDSSSSSSSSSNNYSRRSSNYYSRRYSRKKTRKNKGNRWNSNRRGKNLRERAIDFFNNYGTEANDIFGRDNWIGGW